MKTAEENNVLIAEFMAIDKGEFEILVKGQGWFDSRLKQSKDGAKPFSELKYDSSWDWLMPVVREIAQKGTRDSLNCRVNFKKATTFSGCEIWFISAKIDQIYRMCIEFIKWYNKNK